MRDGVSFVKGTSMAILPDSPTSNAARPLPDADMPAPNLQTRRAPGAFASSSNVVAEPSEAFATLYQFPTLPSPRTKASVEASWIGIVQNVGDTFFTASLERYDTVAPDELARIDITSITPDDVPLIKPGAIFYFASGYRSDKTGAKCSFAEIRFRRLPQWQASELRKALNNDEVDDLFV